MGDRKGKNHNLYYLCKGINVTDYEKCKLERIKEESLTGLENIDLYASKFNNYDEMKSDLLKKGFIKNMNEDVVIGQYKTISGRTKRLVPIYLKQFAFRKDLKKLGIQFNTYSELAEKLYEYISGRIFDRSFLLVIITEILDKYVSAKKTVNIQIVKENVIQSIKKYLEGTEPLEAKHYINIQRIFINEIFEYRQTVEIIDREKSSGAIVYNRIPGTHKGKSLHDLLIRVCNYVNTYDLTIEDKNLEEEIDEILMGLDGYNSSDDTIITEIALLKEKALRRRSHKID